MTRAVPWVDAYVTAAVVARLEQLDLADSDAADPGERATLEARLADAAEHFAAGDISGDQLAVVSRRLRTELAKIDRVQETARRNLLGGLLGERAEAGFDALTLSQKRAVIAEVVDVRLRRSPGRTFRPETIELVWR